MKLPTLLPILSALLSCAAWIHGGELPEIKPGTVFPARDSLNCGLEPEPDAAECLAGLTWTCGPFHVTCEPARPGQGDWLLRFPSPKPSGEAVNDLVAMEWNLARDGTGKPVTGPAMVVVHESGRGMVAGRVFASGLRAAGIHTFLLHLPGYGARTPAVPPGIKSLLPAMQQAVSDVRRASDAVAALPFIDHTRTGLLGISLGGFVTATVSGLDPAYHKVFILLAGGNLPDVILKGGKDAAHIREALTRAGVSADEIRALARNIEPLRLARRVDPERTWLFSGTMDEVVPPACSLAFAKAAGLDGNRHHIELPAGHYTAAFLLPAILQQSAGILKGTLPEPPGTAP